MNAPTNKTRSILIATLLLGLGASALADDTAQAPVPQPAAPSTTLQGQPASAPTSSSTVAAPKVSKGDKMNKGMRPKDKGGKRSKGEVCPLAPQGMEQGTSQSVAVASGQATLNAAPGVRDLSCLDALSAQTSDSRIRGYLNDARTFLQSASKAQQKAGRDLLHAAEALVRGDQTPQR